ncbi:MAG: cytochrome P450 [Nannocystis sp.]|nr:cytochrome P450 [Nannocystis sp.]MBA3549966.1 cytochrome P450 [Nannocystis sp.]
MTAESFSFNPYTPGHNVDPVPAYRHLLEHAPVYWWARGQAFLLSKYQDVVAFMKDPRFSRAPRDSRNYQPPPELPGNELQRAASDNSILSVAPADHLRIRRLVNPAFSPRAMERLSEHTRQLTREALARLPDGDVVNLAAVVNDIPLRVIGRLLAIPGPLEPAFLEFAGCRTALLSPTLTPEARIELLRGVGVGYEAVRGLIAERRKQPGDDLLSVLIHHEEQGARLTEPELLGLVGAMIVAGSDTTLHTLRFMFLDLLQHPEQLLRVRSSPPLARAAMDESLRFNNLNLLGNPAHALEDLTIRGVNIERGQTVIPLTGAASRDPEAFERPDEFDIDRPDLARAAFNFGGGPHVCLGVHMARVEGEAVLQTVLERFPEMSLAGDPQFAPHGYFRVMCDLPVRVRS